MRSKIFALLLLLFVFEGVSLAQSVPSEAGAYIQVGDKWTKLYIATSSGVKSSGAAKAIFSYGAASMKSVLLFREATAPVSVATVKPVFCVVGSMATAPRDIVIVRLQQKRDHRELQVGKFNAYSGMKMEYPPSDTFLVDVTERDGAEIITSRTNLDPGEYVVFVATSTALPVGYGGYDFSVVK